MATGDVSWFDQALADVANKKHNLFTGGDTIKLGLVDDTTTPTASASDPRWGAGGSTNFSTWQVGTGGTEYTGPITLTSTGALSGGKFVFDASDVTIDQDASGFTDARWGIIYNDTSAGKEALAWVDLGSDRSIVTGPLTITWNASGILTIDQA